MSQKLKLSPETINILKNFSGINKALLFRKGSKLTTISESKSIIASADVKEKFESDFAILDLNRFLAAHSMFADPELNIGEKFVSITEGKKKLNYVFADPRHIQSIGPEDISKLDKVVDSGEIEFKWDNDTFASVNKALLVMKLPEFEVAGNGTEISIKAIDSKSPTGDTYVASVGETDATFSAIFKAENIRFMPLDYDVKYATRGIARFKNDAVTYLVTTESKKK